jgi:hypothetical protein
MRTAQLRDIPVTIVTDLYYPALDNLTASLDHLTRCFCDADTRLPIADEDTSGAPLAAPSTAACRR